MGFLRKFIQQSTLDTKPDPSALEPYIIPQLAPIEKYADCTDALHKARTTEEALGVIMAYVSPKVQEKGKHGDPATALNCLLQDVPKWTDEIHLVRRHYGLTRALKTDYRGF